MENLHSECLGVIVNKQCEKYKTDNKGLDPSSDLKWIKTFKGMKIYFNDFVK